MAAQITVKGPDGSSATVDEGVTAQQALQALGAIRGQVLAARVDGDVRDLSETVADGASVEPVAADSDDGRTVLRHSVAHILAQAVTDLFPDAKFAIGP
ncbi:MAG: threonine--tRNA ligase, partial [Euzebyales bacterium]|nr:threonine--tRNA ligase [Euzebyales bacterium]